MAVNAFREESKEGNPRGEIGDVQIFNEIQGVHSGKLTLPKGTGDQKWKDVFPIGKGNIPASNVSLAEGIWLYNKYIL